MLHPGTTIKSRDYHVVVQFVPLTFKPDSDEYLQEVEDINGILMGSLVKAKLLQVAQATQILWKSRPEYQKCRGFLELASACALCLPSVASRVFRSEVTNQVPGMCQNRESVLE